MANANREGHRRFGNVRALPSGRFQIRYPGPDGRLRSDRVPQVTLVMDPCSFLGALVRGRTAWAFTR